ncbi:MAG: hypothetical protein ACRDUA_16935, partial [Micromonosporaceae bacterium]
MAVNLRALTSWTEIHRAADHHPYALTFAPVREQPRGYAIDHAVVWFAERPTGVAAAVHGTAEASRELLLSLDAIDELARVRRVEAPREAASLIPARLGMRPVEDWEFLWTTSTPPPQPGEERIRPLGTEHHGQINELLDVALPKSMARPGYHGIRGWYGVLEQGQVIACGADVERGVVSALAGIAVRPQARGQGLGAAVTGYLTRRLVPERGLVGLGV